MDEIDVKDQTALSVRIALKITFSSLNQSHNPSDAH